MGTPYSCLTHYLINSHFIIPITLQVILPTEKLYHLVPPAAQFRKNIRVLNSMCVASVENHSRALQICAYLRRYIDWK